MNFVRVYVSVPHVDEALRHRPHHQVGSTQQRKFHFSRWKLRLRERSRSSLGCQLDKFIKRRSGRERGYTVLRLNFPDTLEDLRAYSGDGWSWRARRNQGVRRLRRVGGGRRASG